MCLGAPVLYPPAMAKARSKREKKPEVPTVVRRAPADRKRLPPELEEFARSDEKRLPPPRRRPRLRDPRAAALIPGVANRDARLVFDQHLEQTRALLADDALSAQADEALAVLWLARLWRGAPSAGPRRWAWRSIRSRTKPPPSGCARLRL